MPDKKGSANMRMFLGMTVMFVGSIGSILLGSGFMMKNNDLQFIGGGLFILTTILIWLGGRLT